VNPNGLNTVAKDTVWARPERLLFEKPKHGLLVMDFDPSWCRLRVASQTVPLAAADHSRAHPYPEGFL